ncbi:FUSC family protein [Rhizobium sp. NTR19]|uniref:FUSC family protein n=1 Tax=Neorhizobium turbinariae TaxID=2937795 RepID=A0ABT0IPX4_9HYPH|nr:FUSC family protein [Neorhizobium turbinariae]MCK8779908.1 FUSC family protein [Neorhizobium turbinariae]
MRRIDAIRRLLTPHQIRESMALAPQARWRVSVVAGVQAALCAAIALPLVSVSPWSHLIGFASLGSLVALFGRFARRADRSSIILQCLLWQVFAVTVVSLAGWAGAPDWLQLMLIAIGCGAFFFISTTGRFGPPGALIFVFAASASVNFTGSLAQVAERSAAVLVVGILAWVICRLTDTLRYKRGEPDLPRETLHPLRDRLNRSLQIALGGAASAFTAYALGLAHPGWAALGTVAVMQGPHLHIGMNRALQRTVGTLVGAGFVWLLLTQGPPVWVVIAVVVCLMVGTEIVIGSNYALGQVLVTPMALLMTFLAGPTNDLGMVPERVLDTLIGAAVGMALAVLFSTVEERRHLEDHHSRRSG